MGETDPLAGGLFLHSGHYYDVKKPGSFLAFFFLFELERQLRIFPPTRVDFPIFLDGFEK